MERFASLALARSQFAQRLQVVTADDWPRPTPCGDWTVRDLVTHVVSGDHMSAALLRGATRNEAVEIRRTFDLGDDAVTAFDAEADALAAAFATPGALELVYTHPSGMDITGERLLGFRMTDYALHGWDLARAIGADEQLDPALVQELWNALSPMAPLMDKSGQFGAGPSGQLSDDAPLQHRLLDLTGRRP